MCERHSGRILCRSSAPCRLPLDNQTRILKTFMPSPALRASAAQSDRMRWLRGLPESIEVSTEPQAQDRLRSIHVAVLLGARRAYDIKNLMVDLLLFCSKQTRLGQVVPTDPSQPPPVPAGPSFSRCRPMPRRLSTM